MRLILMTGKGGVGKTSMAAATGLRCAELGYKTLVLSTVIASVETRPAYFGGEYVRQMAVRACDADRYNE